MARREEKYEIEFQAMKKISSMIRDSEVLLDLWLEFEEGKSKEAKFLKQLDKIEMIFQALDYELLGDEPNKLNEFWEYTEKQLTDPFLIDLFKKLQELRNV